MELLRRHIATAFARLSRPGLGRELITGGFGNIAINVAQVLLATVLSVILARVLRPAGYGVYAYVFALVSLLLIPAQFGLTKLIIRETAGGQAQGNPGLIRGIWMWSLAVGSCTTAIVAILALVILFFVRGHLSQEVFWTCIFGIALLPLRTFSRLIGGALRGLRKVSIGLMPDAVLRTGFLCLFVLIFAWGYGKHLTASHAMALHAMAAGASLLIAGFLLYRSRPRDLPLLGERIYRSRAWFSAVIPFIWITGTQQIYQYADILILGFFVKSEQIGLYRVAVQAAILGIIGLQTVQFLAQPYIARFYRQKDTARLKRLLTAASRSALLLSLFIFIVLISIGKELIIFIFGSGYVGCYVPLLILFCGQIVKSFFGVSDVLLEMTGHQKYSARAFLVGAVCNVFLNFLLVPFFGLIGAAIATVSSTLIWNLMLWRFAHHKLGLETTVFGSPARSAR